MILVSKIFSVSAAAVWAAITEKERLGLWYFNTLDFKLEEGSRFSFFGDGYLHVCKILEIQDQVIFEHTWTYPEHSTGTSTVRWELEALDACQTRLQLSHTGLEQLVDGGEVFSIENFEKGWNRILGISLRNYLYGIQTLGFEIEISAPRAKVWDALWKHYSTWTIAFGAGMHWRGELKHGAQVQLLDAQEDGYYSEIVDFEPEKKITFSHLGEVRAGQIMPLDLESAQWTGCRESFFLTDTDGGTVLRVAVDTTADAIAHMQNVYPKALEQLKIISI